MGAQRMDSLAGSDDDEDFFGSYDAEQASKSLAVHELDATEPTAPSPEQLAHSARFRKPVALFLGAMALLSLTALGLRGSQSALPMPSPPRELRAHYSSALPAATPVAAVVPETKAPFEPEAWTTVCAAPSRCSLDPNPDAAWLSVPLSNPLSKPASVEDSASHLPHPSNARVRRPVHTSSIGTHVTASPHVTASLHVAPLDATPKPATAATAGFTSVARFPDAR